MAAAMRRQKQPGLNCFVLQCTGRAWQPNPPPPLTTHDAQDVREHWIFDKVLGRGQFGVTRLVVNRASGERAACKSISKRK